MFVNSEEQGNESGGEADKTEEGFGEFVITGGDAAKVFDSLKEVLDDMPFAITTLAVGASLLAVGTRWDARGDAALGEPLAELIAVITFVGDQDLGGNFRHHGFGVGDIRLMTGAEQEADRLSEPIDHRVNFGVHATLGAAHRLRSLSATRIARAAMQLYVSGIQKPLGTFERQLDLAKELGEDSLARPSSVILIDAVPRRLWPVNGPPFATLT